jgi:endonuclease YncB( thermonuclease family)
MNTLVRAGWAVARPSKTTDYVTTEAEAEQKKLGLWQGEFMMNRPASAS